MGLTLNKTYTKLKYFYEPLELHVIIQTPYRVKRHLGEKDPLTFEKDLSMVYVFWELTPGLESCLWGFAYRSVAINSLSQLMWPVWHSIIIEDNAACFIWYKTIQNLWMTMKSLLLVQPRNKAWYTPPPPRTLDGTHIIKLLSDRGMAQNHSSCFLQWWR